VIIVDLEDQPVPRSTQQIINDKIIGVFLIHGLSSAGLVSLNKKLKSIKNLRNKLHSIVLMLAIAIVMSS